MSAIILLIFISIVFSGIFLFAFIWAVKSGQYDDDYSPSVRILFENRQKETKASLAEHETEKQPDLIQNIQENQQ